MKIKYLAFLVTAIVLMSCSKEGEQGLTGPAGPAGPSGPSGPTGATGQPGNANVTVYNFGSRTFTGVTNYILTISQGKVDSSIILAYYNPVNEGATAWYPIPGMGSLAHYETRFIMFQTPGTPANYSFSVRLVEGGTNTMYTSAVTFTKTRIFIVPATTLINGRGEPALDVSDYRAVCRFYNIPE